MKISSFLVYVEGGETEGPEEYNGGIADWGYPNRFHPQGGTY